MQETKKTVIKSTVTGDSIIRIDHKSGLTIFVCEMEGFNTTEALFATKYGSINTSFKTSDEDDYCTVPEGIAHFLEHKLFENEDCDVFSLYAKTGANANAFTSFDKTAYLFHCSDNYKESLEILLSFVQEPYFTEESVTKELGIIGQEIRMTNDNPGWKVFFNVLKCLYHEHPVKIDIAGTEESIAQITDKLLYRCYNTFYNLHNMVLSIAGCCKADEVIEIADRLLKPCENKELETVFPNEPDSIVQESITDEAPIGVPIFNIGIKCAPKKGRDNLKSELMAYIAMQIITGASSKLYQSLMEEGLINNMFSSEVFNGEGYFCILFDGESEHPEAVRDRVIAEIQRAQKEGLDRELFEEVRRSGYGSMIREMNNVRAVANLMMNTYMGGVSAFESINILRELTLEEVEEYFRNEIDTRNTALSIINPVETA